MATKDVRKLRSRQLFSLRIDFGVSSSICPSLLGPLLFQTPRFLQKTLKKPGTA